MARGVYYDRRFQHFIAVIVAVLKVLHLFSVGLDILHGA